MRKFLVWAFTAAVGVALLPTGFGANAVVSGSPTAGLAGAGQLVPGSTAASGVGPATDLTQDEQDGSSFGSVYSLLLFDFRHFYVAGKLIAEGRNPYILEAFTDAQYATGYPRNKTVSPFGYPPILLYPFILLASLPLLLAGVVWSAVSIVLVWLCSSTVLRFALPAADAERRPKAPFLIFIALAFWPLWKLLWFGQVTAVLLFAALYGFLLLMKGQAFSAGLLFSLLILKPHIILPLTVAVAIWVVIAKEWRVFLGVFTGTMFHLIVTLALWPTAFVDYGSSFGSLRAHEGLSTPTFSDFVFALGGFEIPPLTFILVGVGVATWIALTRAPSFDLVGLVLLPLGVLIAPYAWSHDFLLLIPAYLVLAIDSHSRLGESMTAKIAVAQALVFLVVFGAFGEVFVFPFVLIISLLLISFSRRQGIRSLIALE